jgi:uncharacterized membrane protein YfcA
MTSPSFLFLTVVALLGGFIQGGTGFGYGILTMALWPLVIPIDQAVMLELIAAFVCFVYLIMHLWRYINVKMLIFPVFLTNVFSIGGFVLQRFLPEMITRRILGGLLLFLSVYFFFYSNRIKIQANWKTAILASVLSGIMGGFSNISGPPMALYYSGIFERKEEYNATLQTFFIFAVSVKLLYGLATGRAEVEIFKFAPLVCVATVAGSAVGLLLFKRLPQKTMKKAVYVIMICTGLYYLYR